MMKAKNSLKESFCGKKFLSQITYVKKYKNFLLNGMFLDTVRDENEYRLYGDTGIPCRDYEESEEAEK